MDLTILGNPLTLLALSPFVAGGALMLVAWATPPSQRKEVQKFLRLLTFGFALLLFAFTTLMFLESYSGISWMAIGLNNYVYDNCPDTELLKQGACALVGGFGVSWHVGVDGLSFPMVWLTTLLVPVSMLVEWNAKKGAYFHSLLLIMEGALIGVFVSLDLFVFYIFWELTLIPMFFLILLWGGADRRYAAQKFFIYTFTASVIMLLGILVMYYFTYTPYWEGNLTGRSFDVTVMTNNMLTSSAPFLGGFGMQKAVFLLLLLGFAAKMPSVPVHTWLPDAHVEAPTAGSMLLAGVMLKMGAYGFIRIAVTILPEATVHFQWLLILLGMVSLVYGSLVCLGQTNLKRMIAYSSISHMGLIFLGVATMQPIGIAGAIFMMLAHGIISPHLFAVAGAFKHHYHTLEIGSMRGIAKFSPWLGGHMMTAMMGSLGLPLLAGFVAELAIMVAFYLAFGWWVILPALTLIVTAAYYLWSIQRTLFEGGDEGELPESLGDEKPVDITWHENSGMFILAAMSALIGIMPFLFFDMMSGYAGGFFGEAAPSLLEILNSLEVRP